MKKIIITGVAGLLGSRMAEWILENHPETQIIGIDDLSGGYQEHVPKGVVFHQLDISKDNIDELFIISNYDIICLTNFINICTENNIKNDNLFNNKSLNEIVNQTIVNKIKLYIKVKLDDGNVCIIEICHISINVINTVYQTGKRITATYEIFRI